MPAPKRQYTDVDFYERKLEKIMARFEVDEYNFDWNRWGGFVEFRYRGQLYRFDHSVEKARSRGKKLDYGTDAFAQVVLALEDLARMIDRGIYELSTWVAGMRYLPPPVTTPKHFLAMGFEEIPSGAIEVKARYRMLAKECHPDFNKGNPDAEQQFKDLTSVAEMCMQHFGRSLMPANDGGSHDGS